MVEIFPRLEKKSEHQWPTNLYESNAVYMLVAMKSYQLLTLPLQPLCIFLLSSIWSQNCSTKTVMMKL